MKRTLQFFLLILVNAFGGEPFYLVERVSIWLRDFRARCDFQISGAELMRTKAVNSIISDGVSRFHDLSENVRNIEKHMKTGLEPRKPPKADTDMICEIKLGKGAAYFYVGNDGRARWIDDGQPPVEPAVLENRLSRGVFRLYCVRRTSRATQ